MGPLLKAPARSVFSVSRHTKSLLKKKLSLLIEFSGFKSTNKGAGNPRTICPFIYGSHQNYDKQENEFETEKFWRCYFQDGKNNEKK